MTIERQKQVSYSNLKGYENFRVREENFRKHKGFMKENLVN